MIYVDHGWIQLHVSTRRWDGEQEQDEDSGLNQKYCWLHVKSAELVLSLFSLSVGLVIIFSPPDFCVSDNTLHLLYLLSVAKYKYSHSTLHQSPRCHFPKSPARTYVRTHTQRTLMQSRANTQTCPTLHLFTFYYLQPSLSSILPSLVCPSFSFFSPTS